MPNPAGSRGKVTDTHGPYGVGEFSVLRVGGIVALHLSTTCGRFVFHVHEWSFVKHARMACDDKGKLFRSLAQIDAARVCEKQETAEPIAPPASVEPAEVTRARAEHGLILQRCKAAWILLTENLTLAIQDAAHDSGITTNILKTWIDRHHPRELSMLRRAAGMPRKALSRRQLAHYNDGSAPLLKPNGRLL